MMRIPIAQDDRQPLLRSYVRARSAKKVAGLQAIRRTSGFISAGRPTSASPLLRAKPVHYHPCCRGDHLPFRRLPYGRRLDEEHGAAGAGNVAAGAPTAFPVHRPRLQQRSRS